MILSIFSYTFWWLVYLFCRNISSPLLIFQNWTLSLSVVWLHISHRNWRQRLVMTDGKAMPLIKDSLQPARSRPPWEEMLQLEASEGGTQGDQGRQKPKTQKVGEPPNLGGLRPNPQLSTRPHRCETHTRSQDLKWAELKPKNTKQTQKIGAWSRSVSCSSLQGRQISQSECRQKNCQV